MGCEMCSMAHKRYDRFSLHEVLRLPAAMLEVMAEDVPAPAAAVAAAGAAAPSSALLGGGAASSAAEQQPSPLTAANCVGRRVLCPRAMWPTRVCSMHGGAGWEALVTKSRSVRGATEVYVEFVKEPQCRRADQPMWLALSALLPLR